MTDTKSYGLLLVALSLLIDDDRIVKITACIIGAAMIVIPMLRPC